MTAWMLDTMREALQLLAAPAEEQIDLLERRDLEVDDLGLLFEDAYVPLRESADELARSEVFAAALSAVDETLSRMAGRRREEDWEPAALRKGADWARLRELARQALEVFPKP